MNLPDLITIAEREQKRLTDDGDHCAAGIIRALADAVRPTAAPDQKVDTWPLRGVAAGTWAEAREINRWRA